MKQQKQQRTPKTSRSDRRVRIDVAIEIPARPQVVFAYLSDLENNPEWNWAVTATHPLNGRRGRGSRYVQERAWPRPGRDILEITTYQPPRHLEVVAKGTEGGSVRYRFRLAGKGGESTRLEVSVELKRASSRPQMYAARVGAAIASNLEDLRAVIGEAQEPLTIASSR